MDVTLGISKQIVWRDGNVRVSILGKLAQEQGALAFAYQICFQHLRKKQGENPKCSASWLPYMIGKPEGVAIYEYSSLFCKNFYKDRGMEGKEKKWQKICCGK